MMASPLLALLLLVCSSLVVESTKTVVVEVGTQLEIDNKTFSVVYTAESEFMITVVGGGSYTAEKLGIVAENAQLEYIIDVVALDKELGPENMLVGEDDIECIPLERKAVSSATRRSLEDPGAGVPNDPDISGLEEELDEATIATIESSIHLACLPPEVDEEFLDEIKPKINVTELEELGHSPEEIAQTIAEAEQEANELAAMMAEDVVLPVPEEEAEDATKDLLEEFLDTFWDEFDVIGEETTLDSVAEKVRSKLEKEAFKNAGLDSDEIDCVCIAWPFGLVHYSPVTDDCKDLCPPDYENEVEITPEPTPEPTPKPTPAPIEQEETDELASVLVGGSPNEDGLEDGSRLLATDTENERETEFSPSNLRGQDE